MGKDIYEKSQKFLSTLSKNEKEIYLDNASTTPVRKEVLSAMLPYFSDEYGNPSGFSSKSQEARKGVDTAREIISKYCGCKSKDIIFTSGGTESINIAILGYSRLNKHKGTHIITSKVEHHAVLYCFQQLEKEGFDVTYLDVNEYGQVEPEILEKAITEKTIFCSLIYANNEIGSINNISELGRICKKHAVVFHTDACQAAGYLNINVNDLHVDMLTLNGSKIYGPKGIGCLYINPKITLTPLMYGGDQEKGLRPGTENVPGIIGMATALDLLQQEKEKEKKELTKLRDILIQGILENIPDAILNGHPTQRLPFNVNVSIPGIEGEAVVLFLSEYKIYISTGAACSSGRVDPSHVILNLGRSSELAYGSLRFTLGKYTTKKDIEKVLMILPHIIHMLRNI